MKAGMRRALASLATLLAQNEREVVMLTGLLLVFGGVAMISLAAALVIAGALLIRLAWPPSTSLPIRRPE